MAGISPQRKDGIWYLIRRVPDKYRHVDKRSHVKLSTRIRVADDPRAIRASEVVERLNRELETYWADLAEGRTPNAARAFEAAKQKATALGFTYAPMSEITAGPLEELLRRMAFLDDPRRISEPKVVEAVLGGVEPAPIMLSGLLREFEQEQRTTLARFSPHQLHRWRTDKQRALNELVGVVGDKPVKDVTRADALKFREWWKDRVLKEGLDVGSANKSIGHVSKMLRTLEDRRQLGIQPIFVRLSLEGEKTKQRSAFDPAFVRDRLLAEDALGSGPINLRV